MTTQPDFFTENTIKDCPLPHGVSDADLADFRAYLISSGNTWRTRAEIATALNWEDRKIRGVAQALSGTVIRGQLGYKLTGACNRDDVPLMQQAADAAGSQARHMRAYELEVRKAIHTIVG